MNQCVYEKLKEVARARRVITYSEIAPLTDLGITNPRDPRLANVLHEICSHEVQHGRPMLGAVVMRKGGNCPGDGFFKGAREMGRFCGDDKLAFWASELKKVHTYWSSH